MADSLCPVAEGLTLPAIECPPGWEGLAPVQLKAAVGFEHPECHKTLSAAVLTCHNTGPRARQLPALVFESMRSFTPEATKVVIVCSDSAASAPDNALCSSASAPPGLSIASSACRIAELEGSHAYRGFASQKKLQVILRSLEQCGEAQPNFRACQEESENKRCGRMRCSDLQAWTAQGVLLVSVANDLEQNLATKSLVEALALRRARRGPPLIFMLWGSAAHNLAEPIRAACGRAEQQPGFHPILAWTHPSPLTNDRLPPQAKFENCGHFSLANDLLKARGARPVCWDPLAGTLVATDGACSANGKPDARATFAVFFTGGALRGTQVRGVVAPYLYRFRTSGQPARGFEPDAGTAAAPSNNRGEYLAWCWALLFLLRARMRGRIEIVSDCKLFIRTMEEWLPARKARGTECRLKNYDLVAIADALMRALRGQCVSLVLTHTYSHQKAPPKSASARAQMLWRINARADRAAQQLCHRALDPPGTVQVKTGMWRLAQCAAWAVTHSSPGG